jgi:hypothetical protein
MYVDGANHQPMVDEVQVSQRHRDIKPAGVSTDTPKQDALYLPEMSHPAHILQDSFERMQEAKAAEVTYKPSDASAHVAGVLDELRGSLGAGYHEEIARLESDIESKGLPLVAERYNDGVVYRSFMDAYDRVSVNHAGSADTGVHELLDTAG